MKQSIRKLYHLLRGRLGRKRLSGLRDGSLLVLTYHRVLPPAHPAVLLEQPGMVVSPANLDLQIGILAEMATAIHIDDWISRQQQGRLEDRLYFAVTFDDGWRDNHDYALPILEKHAMPATVFLVSRMVDSMDDFWPGRLAVLISSLAASDSPGVTGDINGTDQTGIRKLLDPGRIRQMDQVANDFIDNMINAAKQYKDDEINAILDEFLAANPSLLPPPSGDGAYRPLLNNEEISAMDQSGLVSFGSHTRTHYRLNDDADKEAILDEIVNSRQDVGRLCKHISEVFCYPNGDTSRAAEQLVRQHYTGACTTAQGINAPDTDPYMLRRFNMHNGNGDGISRFFSTLSG